MAPLSDSHSASANNHNNHHHNHNNHHSSSGSGGYAANHYGSSLANDNDNLSTAEDSDSRYGSTTNGGTAAGGRSRYLALKERRTRLARSRSSHNLGNDDDDLDEPVSPTTASPSAYLASRCDHKMMIII